MSGYRVKYGWGKLARAPGQKPDELPTALTGSPTSTQILQILNAPEPNAINKRFGGGVELTLNRNIQAEHAWDLGQREATITTQGIREVGWSASGMVMAEHLDWLKYLFCTEPLEITATTPASITGMSTFHKSLLGDNDPDRTTRLNAYKSEITNRPGSIPAPGPNEWRLGSGVGYTISLSRNGANFTSISVAGTALTKSQYSIIGTTTNTTITLNAAYLQTLTTGAKAISIVFTDAPTTVSQTLTILAQSAGGSSSDGKIRIYAYKPLNGPDKGLFDMVHIKYNDETGNKGDNEITFLLGCIINTVTINYENGSDAAIKFNIDGYAMVDPTATFSVPWADLKDWVAEDLRGDVFTFGCLSTSENGTNYSPVALTDSSSIEINTGTGRLPDCGKTWYAAYNLGNLEYTLSTSTYSDDPNKYLSKVYGINTFTPGAFQMPGKVPFLIKYAKMQTQDTVYPILPNKYLSVDMNYVKTSTVDRTYSVSGDAIMDEPDLSPRNIKIVVMSSG